MVRKGIVSVNIFFLLTFADVAFGQVEVRDSVIISTIPDSTTAAAKKGEANRVLSVASSWYTGSDVYTSTYLPEGASR